MAPHSSILAWRIPWTEEPGGLQSMGSQRAGHNRANDTFTVLQHWQLQLDQNFLKMYLVKHYPWRRWEAVKEIGATYAGVFQVFSNYSCLHEPQGRSQGIWGFCFLKMLIGDFDLQLILQHKENFVLILAANSSFKLNSLLTVSLEPRALWISLKIYCFQDLLYSTGNSV